MAIYMDYEGIKGNVTAEGYEGMILLDHIQFAVKRTISMQPGAMINREVATPKFDVFKTWKKMDRSTPSSFKEILTGSAGKQVKIYVVRTSKGKLEKILFYTLEDCLPTFYDFVTTNRDLAIPVERLYLSYSSIIVNKTVFSAHNKKRETLRHGYDLTTAKGL